MPTAPQGRISFFIALALAILVGHEILPSGPALAADFQEANATDTDRVVLGYVWAADKLSSSAKSATSSGSPRRQPYKSKHWETGAG